MKPETVGFPGDFRKFAPESSAGSGDAHLLFGPVAGPSERIEEPAAEGRPRSGRAWAGASKWAEFREGVLRLPGESAAQG